MSEAIDVLMGEHRVIESVLGALEAEASSLGRGRRLERGRVAEFARFFADFADRCHHGKEEDLLFRRMVDFGFSEREGPIAAMLYEHTLGRQHVGVLRGIGAGSGPVGGSEQATFVAQAEGYVPLLRSHILKEDHVLYPLALQVLPEDELRRLAERYAEFQEQAIGAGAYEEMRALAARLAAGAVPAAVAR